MLDTGYWILDTVYGIRDTGYGIRDTGYGIQVGDANYILISDYINFIIMTKGVIINKLESNHLAFIEMIYSLSESEFVFSMNDKWTAGQQLKHIYLSVSPLKKGMMLPMFVLGVLFGKSNRQSRDYDSLVKKYHDKLQTGGVASGRYIPAAVNIEQRDAIAQNLINTVTKLCKHISRLNESDLDKYILPHPLLGKLTIREMLYFTIYHVEHHQKLILNSIGRS